MGRKMFRAAGIFIVALWLDARLLGAAGPIDHMKETLAHVVELLKDPSLQGDERRALLREAITYGFDFEEMAKRSLGIYWKRYTERQKEFVPAFIDFVSDSYLDLIEAYKDEKIVFVRERAESDFAQVDTKILSRGSELPVSYKLHNLGGEWKVYDVHIENVSLVNNYRSQFNRVLAGESFDELLRRLQHRKIREVASRRMWLDPTIPYLLITGRSRF